MTAYTPAYDHIVVVIEENHSYAEIIGSIQAPYINSLATGGAILTNYHSVTHPSEPNYFALYAGSTFGVLDDADHTEPGPTLASILQANGESFLGYAETGSPRKHNPWESFPEGFSVERNFSTFPSNDFSQLPNVSFVIPNPDDDMHDGTIAQADQWLQTNLDGYAQWARTHNSLLIVVWDEDDSSAGNQVPAILYGAHVNTGTYSGDYNHYDLLNTLLTASHLSAPNQAATAGGIGNGVFHSPPQNDFGGDLRSDLLWVNVGGIFTEWQSTGSAFTANAFVGSVSPGWSLAGTGEFNGDGNADLVWRNGTTGTFTIWDSTDNGFTPNSFVGSVDTSWSMTALADFNGDGMGDLLWQNGTTFTEWQSTGSGFAPNVYVNSVGAGWNLVGTGDFTGNGMADLVWQNGNIFTVWDSTGSGFTPNSYIGSVTAGWSLAGVGDFTGSGKDDLLWSNGSIGLFTIWDSTGSGFTPNSYVDSVASGWGLAGTGDYNGDGVSDLMWRNTSTGTFAEWQSTGNGFTPNVYVNGSVGTNWTLESSPTHLHV